MKHTTLVLSLLLIAQALPAAAQSERRNLSPASAAMREQGEDRSDAFYMQLDYKVAARQEAQLRGKRPVYTLDEISEDVRPLADGNQIKNQKTRSFARDEHGRTRIDYTNSWGAQRIAILDLAAQTAYLVRPERKDVLRLSGADLAPPAKPAASAAPSDAAPSQPSPFSSSEHKKLGVKEMQGLQVTGSTWEFITPAGSQGNDRDMKDGTEAWHSADLGMNLYFRSTSARFGDRITRVENLKFGPVPASLFALPDGYPIRDVVLPKITGGEK
jgi:hypothetical protein